MSLLENIYGDQLRIQQVLLNFMTNAVKFNMRGKPVNITCTVLEL